MPHSPRKRPREPLHRAKHTICTCADYISGISATRIRCNARWIISRNRWRKIPNLARSYAALANSQTLYSGYAGTPPKDLLAKAHANAARAVDLEPNLAEAHASLAVVAQDCDWDWPTAEKEYKRAIALNPNYATAHHWYGEYLGLMGRFAESSVELERARQLDPLSLIIAADRGVNLYYARDYDGAIRQLRTVIDMEPDFPRTAALPYAYLRKGMNTEALAFVNRSRERGDSGPWYWSNAAYIYGQAGDGMQAHAELAMLEDISARQPVDAITLVAAYVGTGDNERALARARTSARAAFRLAHQCAR